MENDEEDRKYANQRKVGHPLGRNAPHIPNKQEAKELRRLMKKSGESADTVKADVANRRKLAEAQKSPTKGDAARREQFLIKRMKRAIADLMGLPATHPDVEKRFKQR